MEHETALRIVGGGQLNPPILTVGMHTGDFCLPNATLCLDLPMVERHEPTVCRDGNRVKHGRMCDHDTLLCGTSNHKSYQPIRAYKSNNLPGRMSQGALTENLLLLMA